jgi:hypothetical protein
MARSHFLQKYEKMALLGGEYYFDVALFEENATVPLVYKTRYLTMFISGTDELSGIWLIIFPTLVCSSSDKSKSYFILNRILPQVSNQ